MGNSNHSNYVYAVKHREDGNDCSPIFRSPISPDKLLSTPDQNCRNMRDIFLKSFNKNASKPCFGKINVTKNSKNQEQRDVSHITFQETFQRAQYLGSALIANNLCSAAEDLTYVESGRMVFVGIFAKNRQEWGLIDVACVLYGITSVPLYDTLGLENLTYCLDQTQMTTCFCSGQTAESLLKLSKFGNLKNLILLESPTPEVLQQLKKKFKIIYFDQLIAMGEKKKIDYNQVKIDQNDCLTFSYTSGTTGPPKGAMLSHRNFTSMVNSLQVQEDLRFTNEDSYLSFLPLPHVFERCILHGVISSGAFVTFYSGDIFKIKEDAQVVKPTIFVAVPRLYNRIVEGVQKKFSETAGISKCLVNMGMDSKRETMEKNGSFKSGFYDKVVFSKTQEAFGGRVRLMITGSAPIKKEVQTFMKIIMACPMIEGYGQTQNTAGAFVQKSKDPNLPHVGGIVTGLEFKLSDIPEMKYLHTDKNQKGQPTPRGQIWLRGPQVFLGYYKLPDKTNQAKTKDGWLKTGDVGMMMPGSLAMRIIDRKKNIFKLQQGQYIASQKVEAVYCKNPMISQAFLYGDSTQNFAVAILSVKQQQTRKLAESLGIKTEGRTMQQFCGDKTLRIAVCKELDGYGKKEGLMSFQQAKNVWLEPKTFSQVGVTTNTMKLQRFQAKVHYKKEIQHMYQEGMLPLK